MRKALEYYCLPKPSEINLDLDYDLIVDLEHYRRSAYFWRRLPVVCENYLVDRFGKIVKYPGLSVVPNWRYYGGYSWEIVITERATWGDEIFANLSLEEYCDTWWLMPK